VEHFSIAEKLEHRADKEADAGFLQFETCTWSVGEAAEQARSVAASLLASGIKPGDRVAVMLGNCPEFVAIWFGCAYAGVVFVPLNPELMGEPLRYVLHHSEPALLVSSAKCLRKIEQACGSVAELPFPVVSVDPEPDPGTEPWSAWSQQGSTGPVHSEPDDPLSIIYTSGTTGMPKGVVLPHYCYVHTGATWTRHFRVGREDVWMTPLPLFHVNAQQTAVMGALTSGCETVVRPHFSASGYFREAAACGATCASYIGSMLYMLLKQPPGAGDREHRLRLLAGGPAPADIFRTFEERFGVALYEAYGLTETATWCLANPYDAPKIGSCGQELPYTEVEVQAPDGSRVATDERGEIVVRTSVPASFILEYFRDEAATAEAWRGGWFHTGDAGSVDADGYFTFHGRIKDAIRRRGENISAVQIEDTLLLHPSVVDAAAVGVPSDLGEEEIKVCLVLTEENGLTAGEVTDFCAERLPRFMVPRFVEFCDALPRTATQRVQKWKLRERGVESAFDRLES